MLYAIVAVIALILDQLLKYWTEQAYLQSKAQTPNDKTDPIEVVAYGMEKGKRKVTVLKAAQGYKAYEEMLIYYAMNTLTDDGKETALPDAALGEGQREREWVNLGGQLVPQADLDELIRAAMEVKISQTRDE